MYLIATWNRIVPGQGKSGNCDLPCWGLVTIMTFVTACLHWYLQFSISHVTLSGYKSKTGCEIPATC